MQTPRWCIGLYQLAEIRWSGCGSHLVSQHSHTIETRAEVFPIKPFRQLLSSAASKPACLPLHLMSAQQCVSSIPLRFLLPHFQQKFSYSHTLKQITNSKNITHKCAQFLQLQTEAYKVLINKQCGHWVRPTQYAPSASNPDLDHLTLKLVSE